MRMEVIESLTYFLEKFTSLRMKIKKNKKMFVLMYY